MKTNQDHLKFLDKLKFWIFSQLRVGMPVQIVSYDKSSHSADVVPLNKLSNGAKYKPILSCAVARHCETGSNAIKKGDAGFVLFMDRDISNFTGNKFFTLGSSRMHNINDAVVIALWG